MQYVAEFQLTENGEFQGFISQTYLAFGSNHARKVADRIREKYNATHKGRNMEVTIHQIVADNSAPQTSIV